MPYLDRKLNIDLPAGQSAFLWGARKTGKSTYLRHNFPDSIRYDFLETDLFMKFSKKPSLLREQLSAEKPGELRNPIILDEVQKIPRILDEVHWLIENQGLRFILCGSSARKLKRGGANLLGGRTWRFEMYPFVSVELENWDLLHVLNNGLIPSHYLQEDAAKSLKAYTQDYLKEEVFAEGLTRNIPAFSRFFDSLGYSHGELTNYSNIASDCGVDSKTVKEYYQILIDTLLGTRIEPFRRTKSRAVISKTPKFYLFDPGVAGALTKRWIDAEKGAQFGKAFEHFILTELIAHRSYTDLDYVINFWRTKTGLEVHFILAGGEVAVEAKGSSQINNRDLKPIKAFTEEFTPRLAIVVCNEPEERIVEGVRITPYRVFLSRLWGGEIIK